MSKGFAPPPTYTLRLLTPDFSQELAISVVREGGQKRTDGRAFRAAGLIWALIRYPNESNHRRVSERFDAAYADQLMEIGKGLEGKRFTGRLQAGDRLVSIFLSHEEKGVEAKDPADFYEGLAS